MSYPNGYLPLVVRVAISQLGRIIFLLLISSTAFSQTSEHALPPAAADKPYDTSARQVFDQLAEKIRTARRDKPCDNITGGIAWGNSYELEAYLEMFAATGDRGYLDRFVELADRVVAARADKAGEPDYRGHLRRGWLTGGHYTWGVPVVLLDAAGHPSLEVITSLNSHNNLSAITVTPGLDGKFAIIVVNTKERKTLGEWRDLTMADVESRVNPAPDRVGPLHVRRIGGQPPAAYENLTPPTAKTVLHGHHTGRIIAPLARFALLGKTHPELSGYSVKMAAYLRTAEETIPELEQTWIDQGDRGYYVFERDCPFWADGLPEPHNTLASTGTAFLWLADATGNPLYRRRAEQLARFIQGNLDARPDGTCMFFYWFGVLHRGWTAQDNLSTHTPARAGQITPEDTSHLQLTVRFMAECAERGIVFSRDDLQRMARTFHQRLWFATPNGGSLHASMAGAESKRASGAFDANTYGFMLLAPTDQLVFERCSDIYRQRYAHHAQASTLYGWSLINRLSKSNFAPTTNAVTSQP